MAGRVIERHSLHIRERKLLPHLIVITFAENAFTVESTDGRQLNVPLDISPKLPAAVPEQRPAMSLTPSGLHWDELDEDLGVAARIRAHAVARRCGKRALSDERERASSIPKQFYASG
ncbi:DUF2442 domain-containing protein [Paraburkholderia sp. CI2]|uniref:DUF2442 domain-containing protein n=1 Tax=Paraburkholderia sp. CI2 TaxID=2723093 RepID=UPI00288A5B90|nr:DUF2442 domain-containing protein [Paraburkholderia sp. CI2]